jgi:3-oxoacyl-[acyl-carrier protein] reductase
MKNLIITGCSKGIGFEIVKSFAQNSDFNILAISRDIIGLKKLKRECSLINADFSSHIISLDIALSKSILTIVEFVTTQFKGSLDGVIHNAGLLINKSFQDISNKELHQSFQVNFFAPFILTQKLSPYFNDGAHVLSISSMGGLYGSVKFPGLSVYSSSKSALITLTECLAEEFKMKNYKFNCLALGAVNTEMLNKAFPGYKAPVSANEMGAYIKHFFINGSKYFNGKILPVSLTTP